MPIVIILGLLMGGSASFAAENAVPGDVLFPIKIYVNENVRGAVAVTPQAKAVWGVHLVERRLEEIEKLATEEVSPEVKDIAQSNLEKYTERVKERISKLDDEDDDEDALLATQQLTKVLSDHEEILSDIDASLPILLDVATTSPATITGNIVSETATTGIADREDRISALKSAIKTLREAREFSEKKNKKIEDEQSLREVEQVEIENLDIKEIEKEETHSYVPVSATSTDLKNVISSDDHNDSTKKDEHSSETREKDNDND